MIEQALTFIYRRAHEAANVMPHERIISPRKRGVTLDGVEHVEDIEKPLLQRTVETIESVVQCVNEFGGEKPTVFVDTDGVEVILDDDDRRELVGMSFAASRQYTEFVRLMHGVTQKQIVQSLRTRLAGCVAFDHFIDLMRRMEFSEASEQGGNIQHGRDSLGASVDRAVISKMGDIPEEVGVSINRFAVPHDAACMMEFRAAVVLDTVEKRVALVPIGDEFERAERHAVDIITDELSRQLPNAIVLCGKPGISTQIGD